MKHPAVKGIQIKFAYKNKSSAAGKIFTKALVLGRQQDCDVLFEDDGVSRHHAKIYPTEEGWAISDLGSANGTYISGRKIHSSVLLTEATAIQLGSKGPVFWAEPLYESHSGDTSIEKYTDLKPDNADDAVGSQSKNKVLKRRAYQVKSPEEMKEYYFGKRDSEEMGDHTLLLRDLIKTEHRKQSSRYKSKIIVIGLILVAVSIFAAYQHQRLIKAEKLAVDIFYDMKTLEVQIAAIEMQQLQDANKERQAEIARKREKLEEMNQRYRRYLDDLKATKLLQPKPSYEVELIHRIARVFGESELLAPKDFVQEVKKYIDLWQTTKRLPEAIGRLKKQQLTPVIISALEKQNLPPQFLYLSLQESDFKQDAMGPETRYGYAKGAWQFIPATAAQYGLKLGPLVDVRKYDPKDERFDFFKASNAAARYLKDIYSKEAQASGLLVMASYNWGHNRVRKLIRKMPENPRDRNFWQLIKRYKIPKETHNYVFYIFSAAVIGEDPKYFGFDFDNPLKSFYASREVGEG